MWTRLRRSLGAKVVTAVAMVAIIALGAEGGVKPLDQQPVILALVSDTHTTRGTQEDQPLYRGRFEKAIAAVNAAKVDAVLIAGI